MGLFVFGLLLLALLGALLAWLLYPRAIPRPVFLSLAVREYDSPRLPVNPWAVQDGEKLAEIFTGQGQLGYASQSQDQMKKILQGLKLRTDGPVVMHLCALARTQDSDIYVLPGDASPRELAGTVALREVLDALAQCPAPQKLLLLDIMRPGADAWLGTLSDDVAARTQQLLREKNYPFFVLCACDAGQYSRTAEELQGSAFAHYVQMGLRGDADARGPYGRSDQHVTVTELASFVAAGVDRWAWHVRGQRQTPILFGDPAGDFSLAIASVETPAAPEKKMEYPAWLRDGWAEREAWRKANWHRLLPVAFHQLQTALLRTEQRWRAGIEDDRTMVELKQVRDRAAERKKTFKEAALPSASLAGLMGIATPSVDPSASLLALLPRVAEARPDDKKALEDLAKDRKKILDEMQKLDERWNTRRVVEHTLDLGNLSAASFLFMQGTLADLPTGPGMRARYVETVYFERLKDFSDRTKDFEWSWPQMEVQQALKTLRAATLAAAELAREPYAVPWVQAHFEKAEARRLHGDRLLLATEQTSTWREAHASLVEAEKLYQVVASYVATLARARRLRDQAMAELPGFGDLLIALEEPEPAQMAAWKNAANAARQLNELLASPQPELLASGELEVARTLRTNLAILTAGAAARRARLASRGEHADAKDAQEMRAQLESTLTSDRESIWHSARTVALRLQRQVEEVEAAEWNGSPSLRIKPGEPAQVERPRRERRARVALGLLRMLSLDTKALEELLAQAVDKDAAETWQTLATGIADAGDERVKLRAAAVADPLWLADARARVFGKAQEDAAARALEREANRRLAALLAASFEREAAELEAGQNRHAPYYASTASLYRNVLPR